ncbi:YtxH domain-containing protein [Paenibacillus gorillae]|uniref:YtxH domain-containing protein n=1 Tax=Paenibacillus gorillae TaxID=1243662 RepID=UPI0004B8CBC6|nr:YtxH domain-containing protein [Paenibacillus gorillae]
MSNRKQTKGFLLGALAGSVVGSITALLLAPKAGKELRQDISAGAHKVQEATVRAAGQVGDTTGRIARQLGDQAVQLADRAKHAAAVATGTAKRRVEETIEPEAILSAIDAGDAEVIDENEQDASAEDKQLLTIN